MRDVPYASTVGSLMYAMLCTGPNICFAVGLVSCYQSNLGPTHWRAIKRIMRYHRSTTDIVLCYQGGDCKLRGYSDVDWGGDPNESRSTLGYVLTLSGVAISRCSKK